MTVRPLKDLGLGGAEGIAHGFFTREGGVSGGIYASLNCGFGSSDDNAAVAENRDRTVAALDATPDRMVTCHQIHSAETVVVGDGDGRAPWRPSDAPKADAMATREAGITLAVLTADCAPVLFADAGAGVVAAAHAGWRGAVTGILESTIDAMCGLGARKNSIVAAVGPCIAQESYEVGPEFPAPFLEHDTNASSFFTSGRRADHWQFDLDGYVVARLRDAGLAAVAESPSDTYADEQRFFSYRRSCHHGETDYGRSLSAIVRTG
jgi:hypothetical protein